MKKLWMALAGTVLGIVGCGGGGGGGSSEGVAESWVSQDELRFTQWASDGDGVLVLDRNQDGVIQPEDFFGGSDLVGLRDGRFMLNAFEDLALLDVNGDGPINQDDPRFGELRIWKDANGDGVADASEILALADAGVAEIRTHNYYTSDTAYPVQGTFKSTRAVELEIELEALLNQLDTEQATEPVSNIEKQIQAVMRELEVENNRISGSGIFTVAWSSGKACEQKAYFGLLVLDLDGDDLGTRNTEEGYLLETRPF